MQVHVGWLEGGTAILAFRGTQTAQDGLQDVKIVRQSIDHLQGMFPGTQAHSGKTHTQSSSWYCVWGRGGNMVMNMLFVTLPTTCNISTCLSYVVSLSFVIAATVDKVQGMLEATQVCLF